MAAHPVPLHLVRGGDLVQLLPQVDVLHRLLGGGLPAARLPHAQPLRDALLHVLRVGEEAHAAGAIERRKRLDHGGELHAVVGRVRLAAEELALGAVELEHGAPAARAGIALAGPVGVDDDGLYLTILRWAVLAASWLSRLAAAMSAFSRAVRSCQEGVMRRMPRTRLIA